jgi:hypothetical protein
MPKAEKVKTEKISRRLAQSRRENTSTRVESKSRDRTNDAQSQALRPGIPAVFDLTAKISSEVSTARAEINQHKSFFVSAIRIADEAQMLEIIEQIYPTAQLIKAFSEPVIEETDGIAEVFTKLINEIHRVSYQNIGADHSLFNYTIDQNFDDSKYSLEILKYKEAYEPIWISTHWLIALKDRDRELYDLLVWAFALLVKKVAVDYFIDHTELGNGHGGPWDWIADRNSEAVDEEDKQEVYPTYCKGGDAYKLAAEIRKRNATKKQYSIGLSKFDFNTPLRKLAKDFLQKVEIVAGYSHQFHNVCLNPFGEGVSPNQYMKILWNWNNHENDGILCEFFDNIDSMANHEGVYPFCWKETPGQENTYQAFADSMIDVFMAGNKLSQDIEKKLNGVLINTID